MNSARARFLLERRVQWPRAARYNKIRMFNRLQMRYSNTRILEYDEGEAAAARAVVQNYVIIYFRFVMHLCLLCKLHYE